MQNEERRPAQAQKILLVEEQQETVDQLRPALEHEGYRVLVSREGEDALRAVTDEMPDLVVLDITLPAIDGASFLKRLRRNPETARMPVLVLSGRGENVDKVIGLELSAEDFMTQPTPDPFTPIKAATRVLMLDTRQTDRPRKLKMGNWTVRWLMRRSSHRVWCAACCSLHYAYRRIRADEFYASAGFEARTALGLLDACASASRVAR